MKKDNTSTKLLETIKWICLILIVLHTPVLIKAQTPYGGVPWVLPGTIQNEDYDLGGQNVGYYDSDASNTGGQYRTRDRVDIFTCDDTGGGYCIGKLRKGEWQRYTVIMENGTYGMNLRYASLLGSGSVKVYLDDVLVKTHSFVAGGGAWGTHFLGNITVTGSINKVLKLVIFGTYVTNLPKLNYILFTKTGLPGIPTNLVGSLGADNVINLNWTDNATTESGFVIERRTSSGSFSQIATLGPNTTTYSDNSGLVCGTTYTYRLSSYNGSGSSYSNECTVASVACPGAPTNLTTTSNSTTQISLSWNDNSGNETGYKIERSSPGNTSFSQVATIGPNVTSYTNEGLTCSTPYYYRVRAYNGDGNSNYSNESSVSTRSCIQAPSNLIATSVLNTQIDLSWTDNADNESNFKIERSTSASFVTSTVLNTGSNVTTYSDTGLICSTLYYYRVTAYNEYGSSTYSNVNSATTKTCIAAPSLLSSEAISNSQIVLNWTDNADNESGFKIEQSSSVNGPYSEAGNVGANVSTYTSSAQCGTLVYFRVRAYNSFGSSNYSNVTYNTTKACIQTPTDILVTGISNTQIGISWTDNSNNETGFRIERNSPGNSSYSQIAVVGTNVTHYTDEELECNTLYYYRIIAFNNDGTSNNSTENFDTTKLCISAPSSLGSSINHNSVASLTWFDQADNESGYKIERKIQNGSYSEIASIGADQNTYNDGSLASNTLYTYRIRAFNTFGYSAYSNESSVNTGNFRLIRINSRALDSNYFYSIKGLGTDSIHVYATGNIETIVISPDTASSEMQGLDMHFISKDSIEDFIIRLQITDLLEITNVMFKLEGDFSPLNDRFYSIDTTCVSIFNSKRLYNNSVHIEGIDGITKIPGEPVTVLDLNEYTNASMSIYRDVDLAVPVRTVSGTLVWDGKDMNGTDALPGVYVMVINLNDGSGKSLQSHFIIK